MGCGGHARSLIDVIESTKEWLIAGLIGTEDEVGKRVLGYPVLGYDADLGRLRDLTTNVVLAIGQLGSADQRRRMVEHIIANGFDTPIIISAHAVVSRHATLGPGTTIGHGAVVNAGATIGSYCIINSQALIEHDVIIGDHCHISTGALINGGVSVGEASFIGSGALIREGIMLPTKTLVSAGKRVMGWPIKET